MRIAAASLERITGSLPRPVTNGRSRWEERTGLLLRLMDTEEEIGQGEASPLPGYSPDTVDDAAEALHRVDWQAMPELDLGGPFPLAFADFMLAVHRRLDECLPVERLPAARFAAESAILDLAGRTLDRPVHRLFRPDPLPIHDIPLNAWIQGRDRATVFAAIDTALARGIKAVKLKIGERGRFAEELELLADIRSTYGPALQLRLDVNESWTLAEAPHLLGEIAQFSPEYVEQPVAAHALPSLAALPPGSGEMPSPAVMPPLAADESLRDRDARAALLQPPVAGASERACRVFVLKPMVLGGFEASLRLAAMAASRGIGVVVSHLLDGPVGLAGAIELALSLEIAPLACGLDHHPGLSIWPDVTFPHVQQNVLRTHERAGLGIELLSAGTS